MGFIDRLKKDVEAEKQEQDRMDRMVTRSIREIEDLLEKVRNEEDLLFVHKRIAYMEECIERIEAKVSPLDIYVTRRKVGDELWERAGYDPAIVPALRTVFKKNLERYKRQLGKLRSVAEETGVPQRGQKRTINAEKLKPYFKSQFKGMGNGNIDHFQTLIEELQNDRNKTGWAIIALMIYNSGRLSDRKPAKFIEWYRIFADAISVEMLGQPKPERLKPTEAIKKVFYYLGTN
jgi:hypothetical protein